ncbi:MAG: LamG domain-containing protein [Elusimicrobia bacterium]|nr:LamG domain-containing protein [Elusimicrobiota bacterium]
MKRFNLLLVSALFLSSICITEGWSVPRKIPKKKTITQSTKKSAVVSADGLVGYWKFDEGAENIANDSSANGNKGTIIGCKWVKGKVNSALLFDRASKNYVNCGPCANLNITNAFTISAWVNPASFSNVSAIVGKRRMGGYLYGYFLSLTTDKATGGQIVCTVSDGTINGNSTSASKVVANTWQMVTVTFLAGKIDTYYNGALLGSKTVTTTTILSGTENLGIGASSATNPPYFFDGMIDEVKIYNKALTAEEIKAEYDAVAGK